MDQHPQYGSLSSDEYIWTNYKLLQIWDRLSLLLCLWGAADFSLSPVPTTYNDPESSLTVTPLSNNELAVSPYPFRDSPIDFHVRARVMPDQPYRDAQRFKEAYYRAQRYDLTYILRRP